MTSKAGWMAYSFAQTYKHGSTGTEVVVLHMTNSRQLQDGSVKWRAARENNVECSGARGTRTNASNERPTQSAHAKFLNSGATQKTRVNTVCCGFRTFMQGRIKHPPSVRSHCCSSLSRYATLLLLVKRSCLGDAAVGCIAAVARCVSRGFVVVYARRVHMKDPCSSLPLALSYSLSPSLSYRAESWCHDLRASLSQRRSHHLAPGPTHCHLALAAPVQVGSRR